LVRPGTSPSRSTRGSSAACRPGSGSLPRASVRARSPQAAAKEEAGCWQPAVEAARIATPARLYDLRSTFASNTLSVGIAPFELARIMGTSIAMIERSYGTLIAGAERGHRLPPGSLGTYRAHEGDVQAADNPVKPFA
jgi:hypothetical protein